MQKKQIHVEFVVNANNTQLAYCQKKRGTDPGVNSPLVTVCTMMHVV